MLSGVGEKSRLNNGRAKIEDNRKMIITSVNIYLFLFLRGWPENLLRFHRSVNNSVDLNNPNNDKTILYLKKIYQYLSGI